MNYDLTIEQHDVVRRAIESGRIQRPEEALRQAMDLWTAMELGRDELLATLDEADAALARGEGLTITSNARSLASDVMNGCRQRLARDAAGAS